MNSSEPTATFKLLLIGNSNVGKSSILIRFTDDTFLPSEEISATIGVDFKAKTIELDQKKYKLTIWDTAGQERFRTLTSSYYRGAHGVVLVYDVTNRETFDNLEQWFSELQTYCSNREVIKMIIGNKLDKDPNRVVSRQEGIDYAQKKGTLFIECSAKTKLGIHQAIEELARKIVETPSLWQKSNSNSTGGIKVTSVEQDEDLQESGSCAC